MSLIWEILSPYAVQIGAVLLAALAWFGNNWRQRRKGRVEAEAARDAADAKKTIKAHKERSDVEADVARGGDARDRLRSDWRKR